MFSTFEGKVMKNNDVPQGMAEWEGINQCKKIKGLCWLAPGFPLIVLYRGFSKLASACEFSDLVERTFGRKPIYGERVVSRASFTRDEDPFAQAYAGSVLAFQAAEDDRGQHRKSADERNRPVKAVNYLGRV